MRSISSRIVLAFSLAVAACSGSSESESNAPGSSDLAPGGPASNESDTNDPAATPDGDDDRASGDKGYIMAGGAATSTVLQALSVTNALFGTNALAFTGVVQVAAGGGVNIAGAAAAVQSVAALASCTNVAVAPTSLTVDFSGDCAINSSVTLSGSLTLNGSFSPATGTVAAVTFHELAINGVAINGTIAFAHLAGTYTLSFNSLTALGATLDGSLAISANKSHAIYLSGPLGVAYAGFSSSVMFHDLGMTWGNCYPSEGAIEVAISGKSAAKIAFGSDSASTGSVSVEVASSKAIQMTLPAKGCCGS